MSKTNFLITFITIALFIVPSLSSTFNKKWIATSITPSTHTQLTFPDNTPFFADFTNDSTCVSSIVQQTSSNVNGLMRSNFKTSISGGPGTAACFSMMDELNRISDVTIRIAYAALVYEFALEQHCGYVRQLYPETKDPVKTEVNNGISCHCPGGSNPEFHECPPDHFSDQNITYTRGFPGGPLLDRILLCHQTRTDGPDDGCWFSTSELTDYYIKFYTAWDVLPVFKMKSRTYPEIVLQLYINGTLQSNFSVSPLDPSPVSTSLGLITFDLSGLSAGETIMPDYTVMTTEPQFNDVSKIFILPDSDFNNINEFDPRKFCSVKHLQGTGFLYDKTRMNDLLGTYFLGTKCCNDVNQAEGSVQNPFPDVRLVAREANKLSKKVNLNSVALMPGETTLMKIGTEVKIDLNMLTNSLFVLSQVSVQSCSITKFSFLCDQSDNQDGFPCVLDITADNYPCQMTVYSADAKFVLATINLKQGVTNYDLIVNTIYCSEKTLTLCLNPTWYPDIDCKTVNVHYNITPSIDHHTLIPANYGTNTSDNWFKGMDGKIKPWFAGVIALISFIGFVVLVYLFWPLIVILFKFIVSMFRKIIEMRKKAASADPEMAQDEDVMTVYNRIKNSQKK